MTKLVNRAKMSTATTGTGTITLGSAVDGFQTFAAAGVANADTVRYAIEDGFAWEIGTGTYTATGTTLTRTVIESSNSDAPINLSGNALVFLTVAGGDLQHAADMNQGVATTDSPSFAGLAIDTNTLFVDAANNRVGVRTASPASNLDVVSAIRASNPTGSAVVYIEDGASSFTENRLLGIFNDDGLRLQTRTDAGVFVSNDYLVETNATGASEHRWQIANTERMRIDSNGRLGIGTTTPSVSLSVVGDGAFTRSLALGTSGVDATAYINQFRSTVETIMGPLTTRLLLGTVSSHDIAFITNNTEAVRLTASGRLGIGTSGPVAKLNVVDGSNSDAVRITQTGTGNALVVEDASSTDSTPFVIDSNGRVINGHTTSLLVGASNQPEQIYGAGGTGISLGRFENNTFGADIRIFKSRSDTIGGFAIVQNGDALGNINFFGDDGVNSSRNLQSSSIRSAVDGTPAEGSIPGRLTFHTTAAGSASPTERMRITSTGNVGIGTSGPTNLLDVNDDSIRVRTAQTPASASATGNQGEIAWDTNYIYVCVATNTWKRVAIATW